MIRFAQKEHGSEEPEKAQIELRSDGEKHQSSVIAVELGSLLFDKQPDRLSVC